ncbi:MAG: hypothetical protein AB1791_08625 [Chloroflexota bacterium]
MTDPYYGLINGGPLIGKNGWCGEQDWTEAITNLDAYAGQTVNFRYHLGTDDTGGTGSTGQGWFVDDVTVEACVEGFVVVAEEITMGWEINQLDYLGVKVLVGDPATQRPLSGATDTATFELPDGTVTTSAVSNRFGRAVFNVPTVGGGDCRVTVDDVSLAGYTFDRNGSVLTNSIRCP